MGLEGVPQVDRVSRELPPLLLESRLLSEAEHAYLDFYRLEFSAEFPAAVYSIGYIESGSERLAAVQVWQQAGAASTLLLVHGYFDHVGLFGHLVRYGLARGNNVVAFDLPGHGLSTGEPALIDEFSLYSRIALLLARYEAFGTAGNADKIKVISLAGMEQRYTAGELKQVVKPA